MNYSNSYRDSISTVHISPFAEEHWNRMVTYSPVYMHWTDLAVPSARRPLKPTSARRNLGHSVDIEAMKLEDELLLEEIYQIRRSAMKSTVLDEKNSYHEAKFLDEEHDQQRSSPTEEYQRVTDFFYQTREPLFVKQQAHTEPSSNQSQVKTNETINQNQLISFQTNLSATSKVLPNINFGPKPQASLSVQLQQSAITRQHAMASSTDRQLISPMTMCSARRPVGSAHSARRTNPPNRMSSSQIPQTTETNVSGGFYEQLSTDSTASTRRFYPRSTNTSRTTMHRVKTKNERARQKQQVELKTILVQPSQAVISGDNDSEEFVPNSIRIMRQLGGHLSAFEKNLELDYRRHLIQFRNGASKY